MKVLADLLPSVVQQRMLRIAAISSDSRLVVPHSLFFAYPGEVVDGRDYIERAIAQGAVAVVYDVADDYQFDTSRFNHVAFIAADKVRHLAGEVASRFFDDPSHHLTVIGVTGTNGKTSITHFIAQALQLQALQCGVIGTLGTGLLAELTPSNATTPDAIQLQQTLSKLCGQGITHIAMEVSSHALVQSRVNGTRFNTAVLSQVSRDHLDYHGTMEHYRKAKAALFSQPNLRNAVINSDDSLGRELLTRHQEQLDIIEYSVLGNCLQHNRFINVTSIVPNNQGFSVTVDSSWGKGELLCPLFGAFNIDNILATVGVLLHQQLDFKKVLATCAHLTSVTGRMQCFGGNQHQPTIIIDYAHTPDALQQVLLSLRTHCAATLWCVFGCGGERDQGKRSQMGGIASQYADRVIITTDNSRGESPQKIAKDILAGMVSNKNTQVVLDRAMAIATALQQANEGDIILIAGKGHETTQIIGDQVLPFSDSEQVAKQLAS